MPQNADAYELKLPSDFKLQDGAEFKFDATNPLWSQARTWAHENGLSQAAFEKGLSLLAADRVGTDALAKRAFDGQVAELGVQGPQRVDAVTTWLSSFGDDGKHVAGLMKQFPIAATVKALENIIAKVTSQGGASFKGTGREAPQPAGRVSDEQYAKMTPAQRLDYARSFDQSQFNKPGRAA